MAIPSAYLRSPGPVVIPAVGGLACLGWLASESVIALAVVVLDGALSWLILAAAASAGAWLATPLAAREEVADRYLLGAGLGIGLLSLAVFALGGAGLLTRPVAVALVGVCGAAGLLRAGLDLRRWWTSAAASGPTASAGWPLLGLAVAPFAALALAGASLPPGILWWEEGAGYDVLAYHLAVPRAWCEQGRIEVLPHNVYSAFPFNAEMIWLLMMVLAGDGIDAAFMCQLGNVGLTGLFVLVMGRIGGLFGRGGGVLAAVLAATCPWAVYLGVLAYVEPGMLAWGGLALWAGLKAGRTTPDRAGRWTLAAGLMAGFACGCKYTALPLLALPAAAACVLPGLWRRPAPAGPAGRFPDRTIEILSTPENSKNPPPSPVRQGLIYAVACLAVFGPWLIRNQLVCGNPVFPLAWSVFGAGPGWWDEELEERWRMAHSTAETEKTAENTARRILARTVGEPRIGPALWLLAALGALRRPDRWTLALTVMAVVQFAIWVTATHLFARFACVLLLPLVVLAARTVEGASRRWVGLMVGIATAGAGLNLYHLGGLYYHHTRVGAGGSLVDAFGRTVWFEQGLWPGTAHIGAINALPASAKVMLVGEARTFYLRRGCVYASAFNHHPLAQAAREITDDAGLVHWLRRSGVTHVLFHWAEIHRLRNTYGLDGAINAGLVPRLVAGGMVRTADFADPGGRPYASLFEVPEDE